MPTRVLLNPVYICCTELGRTVMRRHACHLSHSGLRMRLWSLLLLGMLLRRQGWPWQCCSLLLLT